MSLFPGSYMGTFGPYSVGTVESALETYGHLFDRGGPRGKRLAFRVEIPISRRRGDGIYTLTEARGSTAPT